MKRTPLIVAMTISLALLFGSQSSIGADAKGEIYKVTNTLKIGGDGGWDYATLDDSGSLIFLTRSTHTIVVDTASGKTVADLSMTKRSHGVALVPEAGRGFITDGGAGTVVIFDLKTYAVLGTIAAANDADGVIYDPSSKRVLVSCGDANALVTFAPDVDPKNGKADATIALGGKPEFLAADGNGKVYVDLVDKNEVAVVDLQMQKVVARWASGAGTGPTGLAIDVKAGRLFVGCKNRKMIVLNTKDGSVLADLPIGAGVDATAFRDGTALASCGDGTLTVIRETSADKLEVVQTVATAPGAKTLAVDRKTGTIYLPTAEMQAAATPNGRRTPVAGTFKVVVVSEGK